VHMAADAQLRVLMIEQLAQFTGVRATDTFCEPLQLHLQSPYLLEQLSLSGLSEDSH